MPGQAEGPLGLVVDQMIRRTIRARFRCLYWIPPETQLKAPVILAANHHGWHDGYLMYHVVTALNLHSVDWVEEYGAFPLFGRVGAMPFPPGDQSARAATIKKTIRLMRGGRSLVIFPEGEMHRPPNLLSFGRSLEFIAEKVPEALVIPTGIRYDISLHERPECYIAFGNAMEKGPSLGERTRLAVKTLLDSVAVRMAHEPDSFQVLAQGTMDVNERWDMRKMRGQ